MLFACEKKVPIDTFKDLHKQIYMSMTITEKGQLYDALDKIFTKTEVERHFKRVSQFHEKKQKESIRIFIDDIEYIDIDSHGKSLTVNWVVRGRIKHNQHTHLRSLEYKAKYTLAQQGEAWKIAASEVIEHDDFELTEAELEMGKTNPNTEAAAAPGETTDQAEDAKPQTKAGEVKDKEKEEEEEETAKAERP